LESINQSINQSIDELDSFTFQTVGHEAIQLYSECMEVPLFRNVINGKPINQKMEYTTEENDEVEDLYKLLLEVKVILILFFFFLLRSLKFFIFRQPSQRLKEFQ